MPEAYPDVEGGVRTWLRAQSTITALVGQRVFFGGPKGATEADFPMIVVQRIGGGNDMSDAPVDDALVQIDCWGKLDASGNGLKAGATALVNTVRSALDDIRTRTQLAPGVDAFGINVDSVIWAPDPSNDRPRYIVTAEVTAIAS